MKRRHLADQVGGGRFTVMCRLNDLLEKVVAAHTDFLVSGGDNEATTHALRDADATLDSLFETMGLPRKADS